MEVRLALVLKTLALGCGGLQHEGDFEATNRKIRELDLDVKAFTIGCESVRAQGQSRGHRHTSAGAEVLKLYPRPGARSEAVCAVYVMCVCLQGVEVFDAISSTFGAHVKSNGCELSSAR